MRQELDNTAEHNQSPMYQKLYTIFVNSRAVEVPAKESLSFDEVVILAFGSLSGDPNVVYTVSYRRAAGNKHEGTLVNGESVKIKDGMVFDVTKTNRS